MGQDRSAQAKCDEIELFLNGPQGQDEQNHEKRSRVVSKSVRIEVGESQCHRVKQYPSNKDKEHEDGFAPRGVELAIRDTGNTHCDKEYPRRNTEITRESTDVAGEWKTSDRDESHDH